MYNMYIMYIMYIMYNVVFSPIQDEYLFPVL